MCLAGWGGRGCWPRCPARHGPRPWARAFTVSPLFPKEAVTRCGFPGLRWGRRAPRQACGPRAALAGCTQAQKTWLPAYSSPGPKSQSTFHVEPTFHPAGCNQSTLDPYFHVYMLLVLQGPCNPNCPLSVPLGIPCRKPALAAREATCTYSY